MVWLEGTTIFAKHASSIVRATSTEAEGSFVTNVGTHYTDWILSYCVTLLSSWGYSEEVQLHLLILALDWWQIIFRSSIRVHNALLLPFSLTRLPIQDSPLH